MTGRAVCGQAAAFFAAIVAIAVIAGRGEAQSVPQIHQAVSEAIHRLHLQSVLPREDETADRHFPWDVQLPPELLWIPVIGGSALLIYYLGTLLPFSMTRRPAWDGVSPEGIDATPRSAAAVAAADELARQGRFAEAMHVMLLQGLTAIRETLGERIAELADEPGDPASDEPFRARPSAACRDRGTGRTKPFRAPSHIAGGLRLLPQELRGLDPGRAQRGARVNEERIFSNRLRVAGIVVAVMALVGALLFASSDERRRNAGGGVGPTAFSRSAIGYAGIAEVLQRLGIPVVKSRFNSLENLRAGSVLVIAEPDARSGSGETIRRLLKASTVLLVLPKWTGKPSADRPDWIASADLAPIAEARSALRLAVTDAEVVRPGVVQGWSQNEIGLAPSLASPAQLVRGARLRPIVAANDGILLGEVRDNARRVWLLADPDVIANHGLAKDANASFALAMFNRLRGSAGSIVFDETVHGFAAAAASPLKLLFEVPFVFVTVQAILAVLLLMWAATTRFGIPEPTPPPFTGSREALVRNAAGLLEFAGHHQVFVERYVQATIRYVADQIHAPCGLPDEALVGWLKRVGRARRATVDCVEVMDRARVLLGNRRPDHRALARVARDIHRWKREMIDGSPGYPGGH